MKLKISVLVFGFMLLVLSLAHPVGAVSSVSSDNYQIDWPNLNMGAGLPSAEGVYKLGVTTGQTAPGFYEYTDGYRIRAGFQYIHSIIPFSFSLSPVNLNFGTLSVGVLTNEQTITLTVNSGSAGGYQVKAQENDLLTSNANSTIADTTCDTGDTCDHDTDFGTWTDTSTYGFGYTMTGDDVPSGFSSGTKFRNLADAPGEDPVKVMGKTPVEGHQAGKGKIATMSARINISSTQAAGTYRNILTFIAIPTF
ncbi:MAG TPA: hypothetical protein VMX76_04045 [Nevskiaceae bacterium]|nr:hypothetical protein [Nevskiaceae bacterium]